ncbi:hypothetical protein B0A89_00790 [Paracoccus contaminans]|uniref:GlsB/YeaQ/YmgE family stress response membrane protein n=2 Tax=Paracoccus contaminans TaxID=1945662 RepID=A0A1W6CU91_9RHOB|nr:hypothetical protein B0A89_00790 [Paracoccus contaminans]
MPVMILIFAMLGAGTGWLLSARRDEPALVAALVGAVGGALGGVGFWVIVRLLGLFAGAIGAVAGAAMLLWVLRLWRDR